MRVLFLQQQPCVRALKLAAGLRATRPDIDLAYAYQGKTLSEWYGSGDELFSAWMDLGDDDPVARLGDAIAEYRPDLIHSHNLPDWLSVVANELVGRVVPVIHDAHDVQSLRQTPYENGFPEPRDAARLERRAVEESAALVTVSDELLRELGRRYTLPAHTLVFPNYALRRDLPRLLTLTQHRNGTPPRVVYQGTLSTNGGHYDLRDIFRELVATGVSVDVYPSRDVDAYRELAEELPALTYNERLDPSALLRVLPRYDFGWAGFNDGLNAPHVDTALPNKLFEYLACGLPVVSLNHRAIRRFLRARGLGITLERPSDLPRELGRRDVDKLRRRVAAARQTLTVEHNIHLVADLYERVLRGEPAVEPDVGARLTPPAASQAAS